MTIKPSLTAAAVVSSAVFFFGQSAHAEANQLMPTPGPIAQLPGKVTFPQPPHPPKPPTPPRPRVQIYASHSQRMMHVQERFSISIKQSQQVKVSVGHKKAPAKLHHATKHKAARTSNTYAKGYCTWYVKNKRPDLPNGLGNGGQWVKNAAKLGYKTGTKPRVGAVAEQTGHVAYVEKVHKNGTVTISEMNYNGGIGKVHKRTVKASTFKYIYWKA